MKSVYIIYDEVAEEIVTSEIASNDEHLKQKIKYALQREPQDIKIKVYKVCDVEVFRNKETSISSNSGSYQPVFEYPFTKTVDENYLKDVITKEE